MNTIEILVVGVEWEKSTVVVCSGNCLVLNFCDTLFFFLVLVQLGFSQFPHICIHFPFFLFITLVSFQVDHQQDHFNRNYVE